MTLKTVLAKMLERFTSGNEIEVERASITGEEWGTVLGTLMALGGEVERLKLACAHQNDEIGQIAGKALGYPWFKDDKKNFPDATEEDGVCVGDHVAESIVEELAKALADEKCYSALVDSEKQSLLKALQEARK